MKKNRDQVENITPKVQVWAREIQERITPRSKNFRRDYDTFDEVDKKGKELLASWKFLIGEKEHAIETTLNKLYNMQPSKLSDNRTRQEIEQHIDFYQADRHFMKKCMNHLQNSMKDRFNFLKKQKNFLLDYQNALENIFNAIEKNKRSKIPNPFPKFILNVKLNYYHMFNEELLIPSNERTNKNARRLIDPNTVNIGSINVYMGRTGRANVMTPIHEHKFESDDCFTGQCFDPHCTCNRSESELSFVNHELDIEWQIYEIAEDSKRKENISRKEALTNVLQKQARKSKIPIPVKLPSQLAYNDSKRNENISRKEARTTALLKQTQKSKIPIPVKLSSQFAYKNKDESSTKLKLPPLLPNKNIKHINESSSNQLKLPPLLPNKNMKYVDESYPAPLISPPLHHNKKIKSCLEPLKLPPLLPGRQQNCKEEKSSTNRSVTPQILQPLKMLPQNIKRSIIINKVRDEQEEKSRVMSLKSRPKPVSRQTTETTASFEILNVGSELALDMISWNNMTRERNYRYSRLHKASTKNCFIPRGPGDKVSKVIYKKYFNTRIENTKVGKQIEREKSVCCPESDQYHTTQDIEVADKYAGEDTFENLNDHHSRTVQGVDSPVNDFQDTTKQSDWQFLNIGSEREIKTLFFPMPPKTPKPKTPNSRLNQYNRKQI